MAFHGRRVAQLSRPGDLAFAAFLDATKEELDSRAGNASELFKTDEDNTEGALGRFGARDMRECEYREDWCGLLCSKDHFHPPLALPVPAKDATVHAREYFDMAVRLYKAAKCNNKGMGRTYYQWAARALGHAIHLVEDMGSPQHGYPENHMPFAGHGPSFFELWTEDLWDTKVLWNNPAGGFTWLGQYEVSAAEQASTPLLGGLEGIMEMHKYRAQKFALSANPRRPGTMRLLDVPNTNDDAKGDVESLSWLWTKGKEEWIYKLNFMTAETFPDWSQYAVQDDSVRAYRARHFDFWTKPEWAESLPLDRDVTMGIASVEMSLRFWAEAAPPSFEASTRELMKGTTEAAAGAILAFWEEVKDFQCECLNFTPCDFRQGEPQPNCGENPKPPYCPGRDFPDDTAGIVTATSTGLPGPPDAFNAADHARFWRQIAAAGIEKGIPSLVDYGRVTGLIELAADERLDETSKAAVAQGVADLERKYSIHRRRPEEDMNRASHVGILSHGFAGQAGQALETLGWLPTPVELDFDPLILADRIEVLLIPSGGLYGLGESADLRERLAAFVEAGGTLLVMAQMRGADFGAVPVPEGEVLTAHGWFEDSSCWLGSVTIAARHPLTAALNRAGNSVAVDGSLIRWPSRSTVLLRKVASGAAAMVAYPLGAGWVVASTIFTDWGLVNGRDTLETRGLLDGMIKWGIDPDSMRPECDASEGCGLDFALAVTNLTEVAANSVEWALLAPHGRRLAGGLETVELAPGTAAALPLQVELPPGVAEGFDAWTGIGTLRYRLLDGNRSLTTTEGASQAWEVQPWGSAGQFVVEGFSDDIDQLPQLGAAIGVDTEYWLPGALIPLHVTLRNFGDHAFSGELKVWSVQGGGCCRQDYGTSTVTVPAGDAAEVELIVGPVGMNEGHGGDPGGATLYAQVFAGGATPVATASKGVLNNPTFLDVELRSSHTQAGAGDEVEFAALVSNASMGAVTARYKVIVETYYNASATPCPRIEGDWQDLTVDRDGTSVVSHPYLVPPGCTGLVQASLLLCYPGMQCWGGGQDQHARVKSFPAVDLPAARVELSFGEFDVVTGPALRLPVRVRNIGLRPVEQGVVELSWTEPVGSVTSAPFDLERGDELTLPMDIPIAGRRLPLALTLRAIASNPTDTMARTFHTVRYGGRLAVVKGFVAPAGSSAVVGTVEVANRSSAARRFSIDLSAPGLGYHRAEDLLIGPFQDVALDVSVPMATADAFGSWPLTVSANDGALLDVSLTPRIVHASPRVQVASQLDAPSYHAGESAAVRVTLVHAELARPIAGTLELSCEATGLTESRAVTLDPLQATQETFTVSLPPTIAAGATPFTVRWLGPGGDTAAGAGTIIVPPARLAAHLLADQVTVGGVAEYEVANTGGAAGEFDALWVLTGGEQVLTSETVAFALQPGESRPVVFSLPPTLATGAYLATLRYDDADGPGRHGDVLHVAGVTATLAVSTGAPSYTLGQPVDTFASVVNGASEFPSAQLDLAIVAANERCTRVRPWGVFQGAGSRDGACADGGPIIGSPELDWRFAPAANLDTPEIPIAVAAGDFDSDGRGDVVAVLHQDGGLELAIFTGPRLRRVRSTDVPEAGTAAVAALDADSDGSLEILLTTASEGALELRLFDRFLDLLWETSAAVAGAMDTSFPAGGPVPADFGEQRVLLVGAGSDVVAFDAESGCVLWQLSTKTPEFAGWLVTGFAADDVVPDGTSEVAVGFRRPGEPASGAVAMLTDGAEVLWVRETTHSIAANPVVFTVPGAGARVAVVETPDDPSGSSTLLLLDAASGTTASQTTAAFHTSWGPAAGDTDGDGLPELAVASAYPEECQTCPHQASVMLFDLSGTWRWSNTEWGTPAGPPMLMDIDGDTLLDVLAPYAFLERAFVGSWRGVEGEVLAWGDSTSPGPILIVDSDGDCLPELFVGSAALKARERVLHIAARAVSIADDGETVWSWRDWMDLAGADRWEASPVAWTEDRIGTFKLVGDLTNEFRQSVAYAESVFAVVPADVHLTLEPLPEFVSPGTRVQVTGSLRNGAAAPAELAFDLAVNDVTISHRDVTLASGELVPFDELVTLLAPGPQRLLVAATSNGEVLASFRHSFLVQQPDVRVTVSAPSAAGQEEFTVEVGLANPTGLDVALEVALDTVGQDESRREFVHLAPGATEFLVFRRSIVAPTRFVLRTSGEVRVEKALDVDYGIDLAAAYVGEKTLSAGAAVLPVLVSNTGTYPWTGDVLWQLSGESVGQGRVPLTVVAGAARRVDLPVTLDSGSSVLQLNTGDASDEVILDAWGSGRGTLELAVPAVAIEGETEAELRLANLLPTTGSFAVDVEVRDQASGAVILTARRHWILEAAEAVASVIPLTLPPGRYALAGRLNGEVGEAGVVVFEVVVAEDVELTASLGPPVDDGSLPLVVAVRNTGAREIGGMLRVRGLPLEWTETISLIGPGDTARLSLMLQPDTLSVGDLPLELEFARASGEVLDAERLVVPIRPPLLTLTTAPRHIAATAGGTALAEFTVANGGTQSASFAVSLRVGDGATFAGEQRGHLKGGQHETVAFFVPVPADLPSIDLEADYRLDALEAGDDRALQVATGRFPIAVSGVPVHVEAAVDRDHVVPGEMVTLTLTMTSSGLTVPLPLTAHVSYPPFDERRGVLLTSAGASVSFAVPIGTPGGELGFGLYFASGRCLFLDARSIHAADAAVVLTGTPHEVRPGEALTLAAELNREGTLELRGFAQEHIVSGGGSVSFEIPEGTPIGVYPIRWTFYPSGQGGGIVNGSFPVRVRGPWVRVVEARMEPPRVAAGDATELRVVVTSDTAVSVEARVWLEGPNGEHRLAASRPLDLGPGEWQEAGFPIAADTASAGVHLCVIGVYGAGDTLVSEASAALDVVGGRLLGVTTDHERFAHAPAVVTALVDLQNVSGGVLDLVVDGTVASRLPVDVAGLRRLAVPIPGVGAGRHELVAHLVDAGLESRATTSFRVGAALADLAVELSAGQSPGTPVVANLRIRNLGQGAAGGTNAELWEGDPASGTRLAELVVPPLGGGEAQWLTSNVSLPAGVHEIVAAVNRGGLIPEFDVTNNTASLEVTVTESQVPEPGTISVVPNSRAYGVGEEVWVSGSARDGTYCLLIVPNGVWNVGQPVPASYVAHTTLTAVSGALVPCCVWHAARPGAYDLLVTEPGCPVNGVILAALDSGAAPAFQVNGGAVPLIDPWLMLFTVAFVGILGAWVLHRQVAP